MFRFGFILMLLLFASPTLCFAGSVRLRTAAVVDHAAAIHLGDVATLEGEDALALAGLVLSENPSKSASGRGWTPISLANVRAAIEHSGARMSLLTLSGSSCAVRVNQPAPAPDESRIQTPPPTGPQLIDIEGDMTVRKQAARTLASSLDTDLPDLRALFEEGDREFLDQPRFAQRVVVTPATTPGSKRLVLTARIFEGDRLIDSRTIRADVEARRRVVVLKGTLRRNAEITAEALDEQELWLPVGGGTPVQSITEAIGSIARTRLESGTVLRAEHLVSPVIVRRNELVTIHAVHSGFEVQSRARARAEGRRGDLIEFRLEGAQKTFQARIEGPGVAVIDLDRAPALASGDEP